MDKLTSGEPIVEIRFIRHIANQPFDHLSVADYVVARDPHAARGRAQQADAHADRGSLAGPVWSQKPEYLALRDREGEIVDSGEITEPLHQMRGLQELGPRLTQGAKSILHTSPPSASTSRLVIPVYGTTSGAKAAASRS